MTNGKKSHIYVRTVFREQQGDRLVMIDRVQPRQGRSLRCPAEAALSFWDRARELCCRRDPGAFRKKRHVEEI